MYSFIIIHTSKHFVMIIFKELFIQHELNLIIRMYNCCNNMNMSSNVLLRNKGRIFKSVHVFKLE